MTDPKSTTSVQVLGRAIALLGILPAHGTQPMKLGAIAEKAGLHPSTAHRILNDLVTGRLAEYLGAGLYRRGDRIKEEVTA